MIVSIFTFSFLRGGAAKAAARFLELVKEFSEVKAFSVEGHKGSFVYYIHFFKRLASYFLVLPFQKKHLTKCSANIFSFSPVVRNLNNSDSMLYNIHWINNDTISIFDLSKLPKYSIVTLHDEWVYCGVEHYFFVDEDFSTSPYVDGPCLNAKHYSILHRFVWEKKKLAFEDRSDLIFTCPSSWLAERAKKSIVLKDCDVRVLHNPINIQTFSPLSVECCVNQRHNLGLDDRFFLVFGAVGGTKNPLKGFKELVSALEILSNDPAVNDKLVLGIFGGSKQGLKEFHGFPVHEFGHIDSEQTMAEVYSIADATLVPSLVEAFGQVAAESQACGTPVVAFDTSGLRDVVIPGVTGMLASAFCAESLANCIKKMVDLPLYEYISLSRSARSFVVDNLSYPVISKQYKAIINEQYLRKKSESS